MAKILYPHREMTDAELRELLDFCMEGRKRVKDQLYIIDETFKSEPVDFSYTVLATGEVVKPETLENQNYAAARQSSKPRPRRGIAPAQAGRITFSEPAAASNDSQGQPNRQSPTEHCLRTI